MLVTLSGDSLSGQTKWPTPSIDWTVTGGSLHVETALTPDFRGEV